MAPSESSGPSPFFARPGLALVLAAIAVVASGIISLTFRPSVEPIWLGSALAVLVVSAPSIVVVVLAFVLAGRPGLVRRVLLSPRWADVLWGVSVGLLLRALVELTFPTTGSLVGGFVQFTTLDLVVIVVGAVLVTPIVEELFFRGVLVAATADVARDLGRIPAAVIALVVSTIAFVLLHVLAAGEVGLATVLTPLIVSVTTGILFLYTGRLTAPIVAHVVFNAIGVGLLLL